MAQARQLSDAVGPAHIAIDDGALGCEGNHHRVWRQLSHSDTTWTVVLEDDALPVDGFREQLGSVLAAAPAPIVSLYLGRSRPPQWQQRIERATYAATVRDACFIVHSRLLHCVGVAIRTAMVGDMIDAIGGNACRGLPIDEAISAWARANRYGVAYTWPSLVDHANGPTVAFHRDRAPRNDLPRRAWRTGTRSHWGTAHIAM
jgi:GR25 family glycosyltransferase involved in LPS biosynthesis